MIPNKKLWKLLKISVLPSICDFRKLCWFGKLLVKRCTVMSQWLLLSRGSVFLVEADSGRGKSYMCAFFFFNLLLSFETIRGTLMVKKKLYFYDGFACFCLVRYSLSLLQCVKKGMEIMCFH